MTARARLLVLLPVALVVAACASTSGGGASSSPAPTSPAPSSLEGTSWVLTGWTGGAGALRAPVPGAAQAELVLAERGVLSGSTGCNGFTGTWTSTGPSLAIAVGATTLKGCAPAVMAQEKAVLAALAAVASYAEKDGVLTLSDRGGAELLAYAAGATGLAGTSWRATGINNGTGGVESVPGTARITAVFGSDGRVAGRGGCNSYSATWTTSGRNGLAIGPIEQTQMACDALETESRYFAALGKVTTYELVGARLTLRDAQGATQVTFARAVLPPA